ncbi:hypothetical protein N7541_006028 [Penicillium brevicompactum]|uniref:Nucleolar protein Dnt1-like N-terminal domain-containing protein n=1 Tax=Penicillium brevicompactum TaxID=5074 RepID=A0A9W9R772_PENBR|nr:hypothetical protein N7541_006028 [Penicillium brevicompactum]
MVFIRLTVKIFPQDPINPRLGAIRSSAKAKKPGVFLLPIENPDVVDLRTLAGLIRDRWTYLHPDLEPLAIKQIFDDANDDVDLYPELTVADVWMDHGKARTDGLDQSGTVRIIQKPAAAAPERFPSVAPDWDAPLVAVNRNRESKLKRNTTETRISPIQEDGDEDKFEDESEGEEDEPPRKNFWTHLDHQPQTNQVLKSKSPPANDLTRHQHNFPLTSVESDQRETSQSAADGSMTTGTPAFRGTTEEIRETPPFELPPWATSLSQPQPERPDAAKLSLSKRRAATPGIRALSYAHDDHHSPTPGHSPDIAPKHPPSQRSRGYDFGEPRTDETESVGQSADTFLSSFGEFGQHAPDADGDTFMGESQSGSLKRKQSTGESAPIKEARVEQAHPTARQHSKTKSPEPEHNSDDEIILVSASPVTKSPAATTGQQQSPKDSRLPRPPSFCSPSRRENWAKEMERDSPGQRRGRGLGLGFKTLLPGSPTSQDASRTSAPEASTKDSLDTHEVAPTIHEAEPNPHEVETTTHEVQPTAHEVQPTAHEVQPTAHEYEPKSSQTTEAATRAQEKREAAELQAMLKHQVLPGDVKGIVESMLHQLFQIRKVGFQKGQMPRAKLVELRRKLKALQEKAETSTSTPALSTPKTRESVEHTPVKSTPAKQTRASVAPTPTVNIPLKQTQAKRTRASRESVAPTPTENTPLKPTPAKPTRERQASVAHTPTENTPAKQTQEKPTPAKRTRATRASVAPTLTENTPPNPTPAKRTRATRAPAAPTPTENTPVKPTPAKSTPAKPTPVKPSPAKPSAASQSPARHPPANSQSKQATHEHRTYLKDLFASQKEDLATRARSQVPESVEPVPPPQPTQFAVPSSSESESSDSDS